MWKLMYFLDIIKLFFLKKILDQSSINHWSIHFIFAIATAYMKTEPLSWWNSTFLFENISAVDLYFVLSAAIEFSFFQNFLSSLPSLFSTDAYFLQLWLSWKMVCARYALAILGSVYEFRFQLGSVESVSRVNFFLYVFPENRY